MWHPEFKRAQAYVKVKRKGGSRKEKKEHKQTPTWALELAVLYHVIIV